MPASAIAGLVLVVLSRPSVPALERTWAVPPLVPPRASERLPTRLRFSTRRCSQVVPIYGLLPLAREPKPQFQPHETAPPRACESGIRNQPRSSACSQSSWFRAFLQLENDRFPMEKFW